MKETCAICGCKLYRAIDTYAKPTIQGRSHASAHHFIAERFFGRSKNRQGTQRVKIFKRCPWGHEGKQAFFCYDCHEEVIHNPVFLPDDIERLSKIVKARGLSEETKTESRDLLAKRIELLHEIISRGLLAVEKDTK